MLAESEAYYGGSKDNYIYSTWVDYSFFFYGTTVDVFLKRKKTHKNLASYQLQLHHHMTDIPSCRLVAK